MTNRKKTNNGPQRSTHKAKVRELREILKGKPFFILLA